MSGVTMSGATLVVAPTHLGIDPAQGNRVLIGDGSNQR